MEYNPTLHHRKSIRLKNYDYSQAGMYFITICIHEREHLLGEINSDAMLLNHAGQMIAQWFDELENKFTAIKCHDMVTMPNHFHCIIEITSTTDLTISTVVQWFKTMTSNAYIRGVKQYSWKRFKQRFWQRNYWEHVIRDDNEYINITDYMKNNPATWANDKLNNENIGISSK